MTIDPGLQAGFLSTLRRSGLIDESRINDVQKELTNSASLPFGNSITSLTVMLVARGLLTNWQEVNLREGKWRGFFLDDLILLDYLSTSTEFRTYLACNQKS